MPYRVLLLTCVLFVALAVGSASCASTGSTAAPAANTPAAAPLHSETPVVIIQNKSGEPLDNTVIYKLYCPCYAMYTDEVI